MVFWDNSRPWLENFRPILGSEIFVTSLLILLCNESESLNFLLNASFGFFSNSSFVWKDWGGDSSLNENICRKFQLELCTPKKYSFTHCV